MRRLVQGGAALAQHAQPASPDLAWDDVRVFLACVDGGSFRKAGDILGVNASTVARRIEGFERQLGYVLFGRLTDGLVATAEGEALIPGARQMEASYRDLVRRMNAPKVDHRGVVKISITDGLGTFWMMPLLVEFSRANPNLILQVDCAVDSADVLRFEADLSIQFSRPDAPEQIVTRLGSLHAYPYASQGYADRFGLPKTLEEMKNHRLVDQVSPRYPEGTWSRYLGIPIEGIVGIRSNASTSVFYAIEKGAGIGALPTFACALDAPVVPVDLGIHHRMDIWLTCSRTTRQTKRVGHVVEWVKSIFDPARYPWFRDDFIHPYELVKMAPAGTELQSVKGSFAATPFRP
ncbi:MAG: LysR family transcriptional regulator [Bauldia sp.]|nr:LysR family transcriptional regulator [Bauldia sp.]